HAVERFLIIADELRPAAVAARKDVQADDPRQRIEAAELGIGPVHCLAQCPCEIVAGGGQDAVPRGHWLRSRRTASQSISRPRPGPVGTSSLPFFARTHPGARSARSVLKELISVSHSMMRKFGMAAARWALAVSQMMPDIPICGA